VTTADIVEKLSRVTGQCAGYDSALMEAAAGSLVVLLSSSDVTLTQCVLRSLINFTKQSVTKTYSTHALTNLTL